MATRTFDIDIKGNAKSALAAFAATRKGSATTRATVGGNLKGMAATGAKAVAGIGIAAGLAGVAMVGVGSKFKDAENTIRRGTGATGKDLEALKKDFKGVVKDVPADFGDAGTAIADINTRLGLTGKPLQGLSKQFLELSRITGDDLEGNVAAVSRTFQDWDIEASKMPATLDSMFRASQETGIGIDRLSTLMVDFGSPMRQLGIDFEFAAAMFSNFERSGVATEKLMPGLRQALKNLSGAAPKVTEELKAMGIATDDPEQGLKDVFEAIKNAGSISEANGLAFKVFGERAGPDMSAAIREGRFEIDDLSDAIQNGEDTIRKAGQETETLGDKWTKIKNRTLVAIEPAATAAFEGVASAMDKVGPAMDQAGDRFNKLKEDVAPAVQAVRDQVEEHWPAVRDAIADAVETVRGKVEEHWPPVRDAVVDAVETVREKVEEHWPAVRDAIADAVDFVREKIDDNWPAIRDTIEDVMATVEAVITRTMEQIETIISIAVDIIQVMWDRFGEHIMRGVRLVWEIIQAQIEFSLGIIRGIIQIVTGIITGDWGKFWDGIKTILGTTWDAILALVGIAIEQVKLILALAWETIQLVAWGAWELIKAAISGALNFIWGIVASIVGGIASFIETQFGLMISFVSGPMSWIKSVVSGAWSEIEETVGGILRGISRTVKNIWDSIVDKVRGPINSIIGFINTLIGGINKVIELIPGLDFEIPDIPKLSSGGGGASTPRDSSGRPVTAATGAMLPATVGSGFMTDGPRAIVGEGRPQHPEFVIPTDPQHRGRALGLFGALGEQLGGVPQLGIGGIIGNAFNVGKFVVTGAAGVAFDVLRGALTKIFDPVAERVIDGLGDLPNVMHMPDIAQGFAQSMWDWVKGGDEALPEEPPAAKGFSSGPGSGGGPGGVQKWKGVALQALKMAGQSSSWIGDLLTQMSHESGGNPRAINRWDSNWIAGHPSVGLMQMIRGSYQAYKHPLFDRGPHAYGVSMDPLSNVAAAVRYTVGKFGSLGRWRAGGFKGYALGGIVDEHGGFTHPGEMVLTKADQLALFKLVRSQPANGSTVVNAVPGMVVINLPRGASEAEAERNGRAAGKGFLDTLSERRVMADAKLR